MRSAQQETFRRLHVFGWHPHHPITPLHQASSFTTPFHPIHLTAPQPKFAHGCKREGFAQTPPQPHNHQWKQHQHLPLRALATTTAPASNLAIFRATYLARISSDFCARLMSTSMNEMTQTESTTNHRLPPTIHPQLPTTTHDHHHHLPACTPQQSPMTFVRELQVSIYFHEQVCFYA